MHEIKSELKKKIYIVLMLYGFAGCHSSIANRTFMQKENYLKIEADQILEQYAPLLSQDDSCLIGVKVAGNGSIIRTKKNIVSKFQLGDKIIAIGGEKVSDRKTRYEVYKKYKPGDKAIITINRGTQTKNIEVICESLQKWIKIEAEIFKAVSEGRWADCTNAAYKYYIEENEVFGSSRPTRILVQCNDMVRFNGINFRPYTYDDALMAYESYRRTIEEAQYIQGELIEIQSRVDQQVNALDEHNFSQLANDLRAYWKRITSSNSSIIAKKEGKPPTKKAGSGTCFFINGDGQLVTSYHVVEGSEKIKVRLEDGQVEEAKLLKSSPSNDLAVLQIQRKTPNFLPLASAKTISLGTPVFTMGFPATSVLGSDVKFSEGVINSLSGFQNDATYMQISMPVHPGNSGGPIVTDDGSVVGVVTATAAIATFIKQTGTLPQNVNWGVKADYLIPMVDSLETPNTKANNRQEAIELVKKALCLITVQ